MEEFTDAEIEAKSNSVKCRECGHEGEPHYELNMASDEEGGWLCPICR